jgi:hypothetical protein
VTRITGAIRRGFSSEGYAVIPAVLDAGQLSSARAMVAPLLAAEPPEPGHAGPYFLWPRFGPAGHRLLDLYRSAGIAALAAELLRGPAGGRRSPSPCWNSVTARKPARAGCRLS